MSAEEAATAVQSALGLLSRASDDWRQNGACESGSLHWPVAVNLARRELKRALEALDAPRQTRCHCGREHCPGDCLDALAWEEHPDAPAGMRWYNGLSREERRHWHALVRSAVPADAWEAWKREQLAMSREELEQHAG